VVSVKKENILETHIDLVSRPGVVAMADPFATKIIDNEY